jgi:hypothetical protein
MDEERLNYPRLLQSALRRVVRDALEEVEEHGFPGEHHFFLQVAPDHPDLVVPSFLAEQHPEELTLVLQRQYWDLEVDEDFFRVTLSFAGQRHRLEIPFDALTGFADPAANFALRFEAVPPRAEAAAEEVPEAEPEIPQPKGPGAQVVRIDSFRKPR